MASPAVTTYHGYEVSTLPPPAQTWATDEMLNILEACVPMWVPGQVNSNYGSFGSGITVPPYGFILHNRSSLFTLDPKSPNVIAPNKRPFNTLSAGFVMQNNRPLMTVTLMGGDMQAQGIAQVLVNVLDLGANLQAATDMARFHHVQVSNVLSLESRLFGLVGRQLQAMGTMSDQSMAAQSAAIRPSCLRLTRRHLPRSTVRSKVSTARAPITERTVRPSLIDEPDVIVG